VGSHDRSKEVIQNFITVSVTSEVIKRNIKIDDGCLSLSSLDCWPGMMKCVD